MSRRRGRKDLLVALVSPPSRPEFGAVTLAPVTVPHVAVGLWVATLVVLFAPHPWSERKLEEEHLVKAYGVITPLFSLV